MLPNALSIIRIILTVPVVIALLKEQYLLTLMLFVVAGITDALDGWIAKHFYLHIQQNFYIFHTFVYCVV